MSYDPNEPTWVHCPNCELQLKYRGRLGAPGMGDSYACDDGHYFVRLWDTLYDTAQWADEHPDESPPWILTIDDVR